MKFAGIEGLLLNSCFTELFEVFNIISFSKNSFTSLNQIAIPPKLKNLL